MFNFLLLIGSVFLAFMLNAAPLPSSIIWMMPDWVFLVVCFWIIINPRVVGLCLIFVIGLMMDAFQGVLLGEHVVAMLIPAAILMQFGSRVLHFSVWQQMGLICGVVMLYQLLMYSLEGFLGHVMMPASYWFGPLLAMLCWPVVYGLLVQRR